MPTGALILACWVVLKLYWSINARSIKPAAERQSLRSRLVRLPIGLGFLVLAVAWIYPFGPALNRRTPLTDCLGVAVCALGLAVAIWSRKCLGAEWSMNVELKQDHQLVERGPYRLVRHPIYTGHLLMCLGTVLASGLLAAFAGLAISALGFCLKLRQEEALLLRNFPGQYASYRERTKALIPYVL
ncbi:MAG TPA: isoprenylcysteine carboxylmethyltransferase family protein [Bryobacteraceae bacterium]|nr:isoprenylcysteine carboxylmethyltransferase family protein [Bryobacteraceae bacterium]